MNELFRALEIILSTLIAIDAPFVRRGHFRFEEPIADAMNIHAHGENSPLLLGSPGVPIFLSFANGLPLHAKLPKKASCVPVEASFEG